MKASDSALDAISQQRSNAVVEFLSVDLVHEWGARDVWRGMAGSAWPSLGHCGRHHGRCG